MKRQDKKELKIKNEKQFEPEASDLFSAGFEESKSQEKSQATQATKRKTKIYISGKLSEDKDAEDVEVPEKVKEVRPTAPHSVDRRTYSRHANQQESFSEKISNFPRYLQSHKYLYAALPLVFLVLFFATPDLAHQTKIKTDDFTYAGRVFRQQPDGYGKVTFANGDTYEGNFKDGKFSGQGTYVSKAGKWTYKGNFKNGLVKGKGTIKEADGKTKEVKF